MLLYITTLQELIKSYYTFIGLCLFIFCVRLTFDPITPSSLQLVPVTRIRKFFYVTIGGVIDTQETLEDSVVNGGQ